jgi:hypothetical protein
MSLNFDDLNIGGQLKVGTGIVPAVKEGDEKINGSMYAEGPVVFGNQTTFDGQDGTLMVARNTNNDKDCEVPKDDKALFVRGDVRFETKGENDHGLHVEGDTKIVGDGRADNTLLIESAGQTDAVKITGGGTIQLRDDGDAIFSVGTGGALLSARFSSADARPKPFDIKHPQRDGYRLRYACVEGPEVAVYYRGRVKNEKVIVLPSYWKDFVYEDSISVQLQPIGAHQDVIIKRWDSEKIYLQSRGGMPIDCFFHVYAERNDINPLITEYEGESCEDYPDPNHHKIPEPKRNYKDLNYATEQNTRTK